MNYIIGIDAGTSNVKAVLFDEFGREMAVSSEENEFITGDGTVEQSMERIWEKTKNCIINIIANSKVPKNKIIGIGIVGQGEGCWLIDKNGKPVQNAILWCDGRAVEEIDSIMKTNSELGKYYHYIAGTPPLLGNQMILLKWMKNNRKDILDKADKIISCKDWIRYKLTGKINTELTDCFTSLINVHNGKVAEELMEKLDIGEYRSYICDPLKSDDIVGEVLPSIADELGIKHHMPVIAGAFDISATTVGLGAIHEKDICVILGTTCASESVISKDKCNFGENNTRYEKHPIEDLYIEVQPTQNGTPNINWMIKNIALTSNFNEIDEIVNSVPVGCGGVIYHPYISVAGERAPFYHPYARASFFGMSQDTTRDYLIRAVYEGISFSIRDCIQDVDSKGKIYLAGGGANSSTWSQIISDVLGMKVYVPKSKEVGAKGAALMMGVKAGLYESYEEAVLKACAFEKVFFPNMANHEKYNLYFDLYKRIRINNEKLWDLRHSINKKVKKIHNK